MEESSVIKRATAFHSPAFKACFVPDAHLLPSQEDAYLSELSDIAFPFSTPIFLILTSTFCLSHGKSRRVTRAQWGNTALLASGKQAAGRMASSTWGKHRRKGDSVIEIPDNSSAPGLC